MGELEAGITNLITYVQSVGLLLAVIPFLIMGFKFLFKGQRYWGDFIFEAIAAVAGILLIVLCFIIKEAVVGTF